MNTPLIPTESTTVRLSGHRINIVNHIAISASNKCGKLLRRTDVINFLIDNYGNDDTINKLSEQKLSEQKIINSLRENKGE